MHVGPIFASLRKHKLMVMLLTLQVSASCAIVTNATFLVAQRVESISAPSGVDESDVSMLDSESMNTANPAAQHHVDITALRSIAGVTAVAAVDTLPLGSAESSYSTCGSLAEFDAMTKAHSMNVPGCIQPAVLAGTQDELRVLGLRIVEGRGFEEQDYVEDGTPQVAIISRGLADKLYGGKEALGQIVVTGNGKPIRVIGVIANVLRPKLNKLGTNNQVMLWPVLPSDNPITYILRSAPGDRRRVLREAVLKLMAVDPLRIVNAESVKTYEQLRRSYFKRDATMIGLLVLATLGLVLVTALGIGGLASFWVQQRRKTVGIRRAIGATRGDIMRHFQMENFLIVTFGIVLGSVLSVGINMALMRYYELPRLPLWFLPTGALAMWLVGQLAVLNPAIHAARVSPMAATRAG